MTQYLNTSEDHPIKTNCFQLNCTPILEYDGKEDKKEYLKRCEQEYKRICKERNDQIGIEQKKREVLIQPILERNKKINERMRKIAEDELIAEGEIDG